VGVHISKGKGKGKGGGQDEHVEGGVGGRDLSRACAKSLTPKGEEGEKRRRRVSKNTSQEKNKK